MAAIWAYISAVWAGVEDPLWPHLALVPGSALAGIAVGVGIVLERPKYSEAVQRVAFWLVVVGIAVETVCTITLFVVDERISGAQQSKIIALDERLAPRRIPVEEQDKIVNELKALPPLPFAFSISPGSEPVALMQDVASVLKKAGWTWVNCPVAGGGRGCGSLGQSFGGSPTVGTLFSLSGFQIEAPTLHREDWAQSVLGLQKSLNALPGISISAWADDPGAPPILDGVLIYIGTKE